MRIAVAGLGYVGLTNAVLLAQNNPVIALDIDAARGNWSMRANPQLPIQS